MSQSVLITGAYGGMGKATAKALSDKGYRVFALDKITKDSEEDIIPIEADITDEESVRKAFETVCGMTDELYAIVHTSLSIYLSCTSCEVH